MKRIRTVPILLLLLCAGVEAGILLTGFPQQMLKQDEASGSAFTWTGFDPVTGLPQPVPADCNLIYSLAPGAMPTDYTLGAASQTQAGSLSSFKPSNYGITAGKYYFRIVDKSNPLNFSNEAFFIVQSNTGAKLTSPAKSAVLSDSKPQFVWQKVSGVPYYYLLLFDRPIVIGQDSDGKISITTPDGAPIKPVYQAITSGDSIVYGTPDPSGSFVLSNENLLSGTTYNWTVLNCYDASPVFVSSVFSELYAFIFMKPVNLPQPAITYPAQNIKLSSETIKFEWSVNTAPATNGGVAYDKIINYSVYVYQVIEDPTSKLAGALLVYDADTSNTFLELSAKNYFQTGKYQLKISAENSKGEEKPSEVVYFLYEKSSGTLSIKTYSFDPSNQSAHNSLSYSKIEIASLEGGTNVILPLTTDDSGNISVVLAPGGYNVKATKDGYQAAESTTGVIMNQKADLSLTLTKLYSKIKGRVIDGSANALGNAALVLTNRNNQADIRNTLTDSFGSYIFSVSSGTPYELTAGKDGYTTSPKILVSTLAMNQELTLADITLKVSSNTLFGFIINDEGYPVINVKIQANNAAGDKARTAYSDGSGNYVINLENDIWEVSAVKNGFVSPPAVTLTLTGGNSIKKDFLLSSQSNRVTGSVTDSEKVVADASLSVTDSLGNFITSTKSDSLGQWTLNLKPGNNYFISAQKEGYTPPAAYNIYFSSDTVNQTVSGVVIVLKKNKLSVSGFTYSVDGSPLSDVKVSNGISSVFSGLDGRYSLFLYEGSYSISVEKQGYSADNKNITLLPNGSLTGFNFTLLPNAGRIEGSVRTSSNAFYNATVFISTASDFSNSKTAGTDKNGGYSFDLKDGKYFLKAQYPGFITSTISNLTLNPGQVSQGNDLLLTKYSAVLKAKILDISSAPVNGVTCGLYRNGLLIAQSASDNGGSIYFEVEPSTYAAVFSKSGFVNLTKAGISLSLSETKDIGNIFLAPAVNKISGYVYTLDSKPIPDASVSVDSIALSNTNTLGYFETGISYSGTVTVSAQKTGYITAASTCAVPQSGPLTLRLADKYSIIRGSVTSSGNPLNSIPVSINGAAFLTSGAGVFVSGKLAAGQYTVTVSTPGYSSFSQAVALAESTTAYVDIILSAVIFSVSGNVTDSISSAPVQGGLITVSPVSAAQSFEKNSQTDLNGAYAIPDLSSGTFRITFQKTGYESVSSTFNITASSVIVNLSAQALDKQLSFNIKDTRGAAVSGAMLVVAGQGNTEGYFGTVLSTSAGLYTVFGLKAGAYSAQVSKNGFVTFFSTFTAPSGTQNIILNDNLGSVSGILKKSGLPAPGIRVEVYSNDKGSIAGFTNTLADGSYSLFLAGGSYTVYPSTSFHRLEPANYNFTIITGSMTSTAVGGRDFTLTYTPPVKFSLVAPTGMLIPGPGAAFKFNLQILDGDNRLMSAEDPPVYAVTPSYAGAIDAGGNLLLSDNYVGRITVAASLLGKNSNAFTGLVFHRVIKSTIAVTLTGPKDPDIPDLPIELVIPPGVEKSSTTQMDLFTVDSSSISKIRRTQDRNLLVGKAYVFYPDGFMFSKAVRLRLPVPLDYRLEPAKLAVGYWNTSKLMWQVVIGTADANVIEAETNHFSEYAVMYRAEGKGITSFTFMPNPFSPGVKNLVISFLPLSESGTTLIVNIKLYTILGEEVRTLADTRIVSSGEKQNIEWDGKNDAGEMCLNGRYVAEVKILDNGKESRLLKLIALIK